MKCQITFGDFVDVCRRANTVRGLDGGHCWGSEGRRKEQAHEEQRGTDDGGDHFELRVLSWRKCHKIEPGEGGGDDELDSENSKEGAWSSTNRLWSAPFIEFQHCIILVGPLLRAMRRSIVVSMFNLEEKHYL